jgi:hypothetical protein
MSKIETITEYFRANPFADAKTVASMHQASLGVTYAGRRRALGAIKPKGGRPRKDANTDRAAKVKFNMAEMFAAAVTPAPTPTRHSASSYTWGNYGLTMTAEEYRGYLRGTLLDIVQSMEIGDDLTEAKAILNKLEELKG